MPDAARMFHPPPSRARRPDFVTKAEGRELCEQFLDEMGQCELFVYVEPDPDRNNGCGIRRVGMQNPKWYQEFCREWGTRRGALSARCADCRGFHRRGGRHLPGRRPRGPRKKHDTMIKRRETVAALERILLGHTDTVYTERIKEFIRRKGKRFLKR